MLTAEVTAVTTSAKDLTTLEYNSSSSDSLDCSLPPAFNITVNVVLVSIICILGLIGNTMSVFILHTERGNRVAVLLLQSLAVADNACLLLSLIYVPFILGILPTLSNCSNYVLMMSVNFQRYLEPVAHMAQTGSIWMVLLLAANRYIAICRPLQSQTYLTMTRTKVQITAVVIFAVCFNLPRFFQTRVVTDPISGRTILKGSVIGPETQFGQIYSNAMYTLLVLALPFVMLVILNFRLIFALRASRRRMRLHSVNRIESNENNITFVMVIIIVVFLLCVLPDRLVPLIMLGNNSYCFIHVFQCICNLLFVLNSSVNFVIYYMFRRRFRNVFGTRICGCNERTKYRGDSLNSNRMIHLYSPEYTQNIPINGSRQMYSRSVKSNGVLFYRPSTSSRTLASE